MTKESHDSKFSKFWHFFQFLTKFRSNQWKIPKKSKNRDFQNFRKIFEFFFEFRFSNLHVLWIKHRRKILKNLKNFSRIFRNFHVFRVKHRRNWFPMFFSRNQWKNGRKFKKSQIFDFQNLTNLHVLWTNYRKNRFWKNLKKIMGFSRDFTL